MKTVFNLLALLPFILFGQGKTAQVLHQKGFMKYPIQSGKIIYEISGGATGTETLTFDLYGWRSVKKRKMTFELYGITSTQKQQEVTDGENVYRINHTDSTIRKRVDSKWSLYAGDKTPGETSEAILFSLGGTQKADSTLLGKTCKVWVFEYKSIQEMWTWNGLVLKSISKLGDRVIATTATSVETGIETAKSLYAIPEGYKELE